MAVFRVERTGDYTVMSNFHLKDKRLSLKAKGLLSQMLSLPDDWDYTLSGLSYINRESKMQSALLSMSLKQPDTFGADRQLMLLVNSQPMSIPFLSVPSRENRCWISRCRKTR